MSFPGTGPYTCFLDLLHVVDHEGIANHVAANVLWTIIKDRQLARTQNESLQWLNDDISRWQTENAVSHPLSLANIVNQVSWLVSLTFQFGFAEFGKLCLLCL